MHTAYCTFDIAKIFHKFGGGSNVSPPHMSDPMHIKTHFIKVSQLSKIIFIKILNFKKTKEDIESIWNSLTGENILKKFEELEIEAYKLYRGAHPNILPEILLPSPRRSLSLARAFQQISFKIGVRVERLRSILDLGRKIDNEAINCKQDLTDINAQIDHLLLDLE